MDAVPPGGLRARRPRRRDVLWTSVRDPTAEESGPRRRLVPTLADGTRLPLPAPRTGRVLKDAAYDHKAAAVMRWWAEHGGPRPWERPGTAVGTPWRGRQLP